MKSCSCVVLSFAFLFSLSIPLIAQEAETDPLVTQETETEERQVNPDSSLMLGGRFSDETAEALGDLLLPALGDQNGMLFVNPRFLMGDEGQREFNAGLVFRRLEPAVNGIIGGNIYYDYRETESDATFDQLGFGVEYMGSLFDFRANYYLPEDDVKRVNERVVEDKTVSQESYTAWDDPHAVGHTIIQRGRAVQRTVETITRRIYFQNEAALEGWDVEAGVPLPWLEKFGDVRVFGGYYRFEGELGADDIEGAKARVEAKVLPSFALDLEWYEDEELYGSDYFFGARLILPFELMGGPGIDRGAWMTRPRGKPEPASRMLEPVMRDWHVQTKSTEMQEDITQRSITSSVIEERSRNMEDTLATDVIFVNNNSGNNDNPGTVDLPVENVTTGINMGDRVFVMSTQDGYDVNLMIEDDLDLMGQAYPIGAEGRYLFGDSSYTTLRPQNPAMPTISVDGNAGASDVLIRGFEIKGCMDGIDSSPYNTTVIAAQNVENLEIHHNRIHCGLLGIMSSYISMPGTYSLNIHDNTFDHLGMGTLAMSDDSNGSVEFRDNMITTTAIGAGALGISGGSSANTMDLAMTGNEIGGGGLSTLGSLVVNTNGIVNNFIEMLLDGPLDPSISTAIGGIPEDSPSLLGLAAAGISEKGNMNMNAYIAGNTISDNLFGMALAGYGMGASVDNAVIEDNVIVGGGTDALLDYVLNDVLSIPHDPDELVDISIAGITVLGLEYASMQNLAIRNNAVDNHLVGVAVAGVGDALMDNAVLSGNTVTDSGLGIFALAEDGAMMNGLTITGNMVDNSGLRQIHDLLTAHIPSSSVDPELVPLWEMEVPDYGGAGILAAGNLFTYDTDTEMNDMVIADNTVRDNLLGIGVIGRDMEINRGTITGNTIEDNMAAAGLYFEYAEAENWMVTQNNIDTALAGIMLFGNSSGMDNMRIAENVMDRTTVGVLFGLFNDTEAANFVIEDNTITGGIDPTQMELLANIITAAEGKDEIEELLGMDELGQSFPGDLPATGGYAGFVGMLDDADTVSLSLLDNRVTDNAAGIFIDSTNNVPDAQISIFDNISSGPHFIYGDDYTATYSGNIPGVVIIP
ncbi:MAG: inverse autotransporter beta domain-containing protein [Verrucomicrobiota bacterium]